MHQGINVGIIAALCFCSGLFFSCSDDPDKRSIAMMNDDTLKSDLENVAHMRVCFGHQSVGRNILDGLNELSTTPGSARLNILPVKPGEIPAGPVFAECTIGQNGDPRSKCDSFAQLLNSLSPGDSVHVALMKFCYVDFEENTDVDAMLAYYRQTMKDLQGRYPHTTFIHVTAPLTTRAPGWKRFVKSILGRADASDLIAYKRQFFNEALTREFGTDPLFDLAKLESTNDDGSRVEFTHNAKTVHSLREDFTDDGGHLNALGRRVAARELIRVLALRDTRR